MLLIVFIHISVDKSEYGFIAGYIYDIISKGICLTAVPLFFIISGYLFFANIEENNKFSFTSYKHKLHSRLSTLLLPYIIWNLIALLYIIILQKTHQNSNLFTWVMWQDGNISFREFLMSFVSLRGGEPLLYQFWFLRNLIIINLFAPIIYYILRRSQFFLLLLICLSLWIVLDDKSQIVHFELTTLCFYSIGAYLQIQKINIKHYLRQAKYLIPIYLIMLLLQPMINSYIYKHITTLMGIIVLVYLVNYLHRKKIITRFNSLTSFSFFLYAFHTFIIRYIQNFLSNHLPINAFYGIIIYFSSVILSIFISYFLYLLISKISPKTINILTGNRK